MPGLIRRIATAAGLGLALASCGGGDNAPPAPEPALGPVPNITAYTQISLPLTAYQPTVDEQLTLQRISDAVTNRCLRAKGVEQGYREPPTFVAFLREGSRSQLTRSRLWGFYDTDNYRRYGYRRPPDIPGSIEIPRPAGPDNVISECNAAGRAALGPLAGDPLSLPDGGPLVPLNDSRYQRAVKEWSSCMAEQGFQFNDPLAAHASALANLVNPETPRDRSTAVSDIGCKNRTNLVGIAVAVQSAYQKEYIDKHLTQLAEHKAAVDKVIRDSAGK